jgi:nucleoid-associated protein YgaU
MSKLVQTFRFVIGTALLAAGVTAATPYVSQVVAAHGRAQRMNPQPAETIPGDPFVTTQLPPRDQAPASFAAHAIPDPRPNAFAPQASGLPGPYPEPTFESFPAQEVPSRDFRPPPPPSPLPQMGTEFSRSVPGLEAAYRSTVDVPPPPLLDTASPSPLAASWSANSGPATVAAREPVAASPATYVVRDGDDLTGISLKVYGHAGGASTIWSVNRDRLADPGLLPIGMELKIPPAWSVPAAQAHHGNRGNVIEPVRRPALIRVAHGETLESLARRFYGDPAMAERLFEANRDRLRSPALVSAGMELRLP